MQDATFVAMFQNEAARSENQPMRSGYVGRILRAKIFVTSNSRVYTGAGSGGIDVFSCLWIGRESYGYVGMAGGSFPQLVDNMPDSAYTLTGQNVKPVQIIVKQLGSAGADDPLDQRATIAWKISLGTAMTNAAWMRDLEQAAAL